MNCLKFIHVENIRGEKEKEEKMGFAMLSDVAWARKEVKKKTFGKEKMHEFNCYYFLLLNSAQ